jgi:hypothetical protein
MDSLLNKVVSRIIQWYYTYYTRLDYIYHRKSIFLEVWGGVGWGGVGRVLGTLCNACGVARCAVHGMDREHRIASFRTI